MQRTQGASVAGLVIGLFALTIPLSAHHGTRASYDLDQRITLKGVVTEWRLVNPHSQLYFDVTDEKGEVVHWSGEMSSVFQLSKAGWNRNSIKPGDQVTVTLSPSRVGAPAGVMYLVILPDGRRIETDDGRENQ
jgi:hypothetical protein